MQRDMLPESDIISGPRKRVLTERAREAALASKMWKKARGLASDASSVTTASSAYFDLHEYY
jgi:hypothetical protein